MLNPAILIIRTAYLMGNVQLDSIRMVASARIVCGLVKIARRPGLAQAAAFL